LATFQVRVEGLTGLSVGTTPTQAELTEYLKDGVVEVTSRCIELNPMDMENFARESAEQTSNGFNPGSNQILSVIRENGTDGHWYPCSKRPIALQYKVTNPDSLEYASGYNPVYMITQNRSVHVYPEPGSSNDGFKVLYVNYDPEELDGTDLEYNSSGIKWFPEDKVYLVVLYAGIKALKNRLSSKHSDLPSDIVPIALEDITTSLPTYTAPGLFILPQIPADADVSFTDVGSIETFIPPVFSAPTLSSITDMSLPSVPSSPAMFENSIEISGTAPTYTKPSLALTNMPTIADLSIDSVIPAKPLISENTLTYTGTAPTFTAPALSMTSAPSISDLELNEAPPVAPILSSETSDTTVSFSTTAPTFQAPVIASDFGDADNWLSVEEDDEMVTSRIEIISAQISQYNADIQAAQQKMNEEAIEYDAQLQIALENARLTGSDGGEKIQKYQAEISMYTNKINTKVAEYTQNLNKELQLFQQNRQTELQKYSNDIQVELNKFNEENVEYQANVQKDIQNVGLKEEKQSRELQKYAQELNAYQSDVNKQISEYTQNLNKEIQLVQIARQTELQQYASDIQSELNEFNKENVEYQAKLQIDIQNAGLKESKQDRDLQKYSQDVNSYQAEVNKEVQRWVNEDFNKTFNEWTQKYQGQLAEYNTDVQNESSKVSASLNEFNAQVGKAIQEYQAETGYDLSKYQAEVQGNVQKYQNDLADATNKFDRDLGKYTADYTRASTMNNTAINKYSIDIQKFTAEIQKSSIDYQWMENRMMKLQQEYDQAFALMQPQQQQQQRRR
jgi:hypothetical protein